MAKWRKTVIKKGSHKPFRLPALHFNGGRTMRVWVQVTPSMLQATPGMVHKICGFSRGHHHNNSVRVGWIVDKNGSIDIVRYTNKDGKRSWEFVHFDVKPGQVLRMDLQPDNGPRWGYILRPYHGGQPVAPVNVEVVYKYVWLTQDSCK
jgi:hypothetical protein